MISLRQTNQGGSVVTFVVVAALLVFGVVGTAYFVKQRGERVRQEQATAQADKIADQEKKDTPAETKNDSTKTDDKTASDKPVAVPTTPTQTETPSEQTPVALPTTGPGSRMINALAIGLLVASGIAYAMSRRALSRSL